MHKWIVKSRQRKMNQVFTCCHDNSHHSMKNNKSSSLRLRIKGPVVLTTIHTWLALTYKPPTNDENGYFLSEAWTQKILNRILMAAIKFQNSTASGCNLHCSIVIYRSKNRPNRPLIPLKELFAHVMFSHLYKHELFKTQQRFLWNPLKYKKRGKGSVRKRVVVTYGYVGCEFTLDPGRV